MDFIQIVDLRLPAQQPAGSPLFFFVAKERLERVLTLLLLFLSAEGRLFETESLAYIIVKVYLIIWREKT